jgi:hypothetical protein
MIAIAKYVSFEKVLKTAMYSASYGILCWVTSQSLVKSDFIQSIMCGMTTFPMEFWPEIFAS